MRKALLTTLVVVILATVIGCAAAPLNNSQTSAQITPDQTLPAAAPAPAASTPQDQGTIPDQPAALPTQATQVWKTPVSGIVPSDAPNEITWLRNPNSLPKMGLIAVSQADLPPVSISPYQVIALLGTYVLVQNGPAILKYLDDHQVKHATWQFSPENPGTVDLTNLLSAETTITQMAGRRIQVLRNGQPTTITFDWVSQLEGFFNVATVAERSAWADLYVQRAMGALPDIYDSASAADLEWTDDLPRVPPWVDKHTQVKHAMATSCFKELVMSNLLSIGIRESWATDITAKRTPQIAILVGLQNTRPTGPCSRVINSWSKSQSRETPVIAVIFELGPSGRLVNDFRMKVPVPITLFDTTLERWRYMPHVRCGMYNQFPFTQKVWPGFEAVPCP